MLGMRLPAHRQAGKRVVFKYPLKVEDETEVTMAWGALILAVQWQGSSPCIWALIDPTEKETVVRKFHVAGTGATIEWKLNMVHVGTVQASHKLFSGDMVFHVFEYGQ